MRCYKQDPLEHALEGVAAMARRGYSYYIGICGDALARWSVGANLHSERFSGMVVVSDNATASLEQRVIAACQGNVRCLNVGRGGSAITPESVGCTSRTALTVSCGSLEKKAENTKSAFSRIDRKSLGKCKIETIVNSCGFSVYQIEILRPFAFGT